MEEIVDGFVRGVETLSENSNITTGEKTIRDYLFTSNCYQRFYQEVLSKYSLVQFSV